MLKFIAGAACCLAVSLGFAQTPVTLFTFRSPNGNVQQHFFATPNGGPLSLWVFGFNHPNATLEADYAIGKPLRLAKGWSSAPALSAEYVHSLTNAGLFTFTSGRVGNLSLALPTYAVLDMKTHRMVFLIPSGRIGYALGHGVSLGLESKLKYGAGNNISLCGGFLEAHCKAGWVRLSYLGKITGGQNELRLVLGTSF